MSLVFGAICLFSIPNKCFIFFVLFSPIGEAKNIKRNTPMKIDDKHCGSDLLWSALLQSDQAIRIDLIWFTEGGGEKDLQKSFSDALRRRPNKPCAHI